MKSILITLLLFLGSFVYSQNFTVTCYANDLIDKRSSCSPCNQLDQIFTGVLITYNGTRYKYPSDTKIEIYNDRYFWFTYPTMATLKVDVTKVTGYSTKSAFITFLQTCGVGDISSETDPTFPTGTSAQLIRGDRTLVTANTLIDGRIATQINDRVKINDDTIIGNHTHLNTSSFWKSGTQQVQTNSGGVLITDGAVTTQLDQSYLQFDNGFTSAYYGPDSAGYGSRIKPTLPSNLFTLTELKTEQFDCNMIMGDSIESTPPTLGQAMIFNGTKWVPSDITISGGGFDNPATVDLDMAAHKILFSDAFNDVSIESDSVVIKDDDGNKTKINSENIMVSGGSTSSSLSNGGLLVSNTSDLKSYVNPGEITIVNVEDDILKIKDTGGLAEILMYTPKPLSSMTGIDVLPKSKLDSAYLKISLTLSELNTAVNDANIASLTGSETLTNKTLAIGSNTVSGTKAEFDAACTDGNFMYVGDTPSGVWSTSGNTSIAALTLGSTDNTALTITSGTAAVNINNANTNAGTVNIASGTTSNQTVNIAFAAGTHNKTVNINNDTGNSGTSINASGTGVLDLFHDSRGIRISSSTLNMGSIGSVFTTYNLAAIAGSTSVNIANTGSGNKTVAMGSTVGTSSTTLRSGSGNVNINDAGTGGILLGTSTSAQTINVGDAAGAKTVTVGSTNTTSTTTLKAGSGGLILTGLQTVTGATATDANTNANTTATGAVFIWNADTGGVFLMVKE